MKMEPKINLKKMKQKTHRYIQQDGLFELLIGGFFIFYGGFFHDVLSGFTSNFPNMPFILLFAFSAFIIEWIRRKITYPRIGRVNLIDEFKPLYFVPVIILLIAVPFLVYLSAIFGWNIDFCIPWLPALFGVMITGIFFSTIALTGDRRYYLFIILSVVSGIFFSISDITSPSLSNVGFFLTIGIPLVLFGTGKLIYFMRIPVEES
jgi:hypothetical protein